MTLKQIKTEENDQLCIKSAPKSGFMEYMSFLIEIREVVYMYEEYGKVLMNNLAKLNQVVVFENGKEI